MTERQSIYIATTTFPGADSAETVARVLVEENLAACAQVGGEMISLYRWQGGVRRDNEVNVTLKVGASQLLACLTRLRDLHPCEVPQIVAWEANVVDEPYRRWVCGESD